MTLLGLKLVYDRSPNFNALLKKQGLRFKTIVSKKNNQMSGLFSISSSPRFLFNRPIVAGYLGDFRITNDLKTTLFWRKNYNLAIDSFSQTEELDKPSVFITAILKNNYAAKKSLLENRRLANNFKYHFLRSVEMINILSKPIFRLNTHSSLFRTRRATPNDEAAIKEFIIKAEQKKILGFDFARNHHELWKHGQFDMSQFLIVEDASGRMVGVTLPWSPDSIKSMILKDINWSLKSFLKLVRLAGINTPEENTNIKVLYLTHLNIIDTINMKKILESILHWLHNDPSFKNFHMISFANWSNARWSEYLNYSVTVDLYEVTSSSSSPKIFGVSDDMLSQPFGFEMAYV